ncbi:30S ribosome-binding factor RbfA [Brachyspira pilosicoli]|uniref:Ribosome-binding factor A n=4 Tax=Brachyspira pilosicoli TaxID=52584 RepID=D8IG36_BRAP9|nr:MULTISPECIES: 30S ribosome-binding factor RbfA [Brachyspira]ADK32100.1 ribosome binding factor A [Brachyspira pilosicoli 95/1000]AGA66173.1 ribosome-binding factor A [Brachyspira pilosicoli P43/6/78]MBW5378632.1 30S ribosome-binding factor RbfA [Brachyspira pilosicoli]MBW5382759.1 30S ribosome-binding factor RbfA [Brachyspira pilosicoli]MBW5392393.1 30S ribosome-binding factor RbfA [Brachyspira pilosicoli]
MSSHRILRVNENIKQILSTILLREIEDPRIKNNLVTITRIDTAKDLKEAKVYFVCLDPSKQNEVLNGLNSAKGVIFSYLRKQLTIRYVPNLTFYYDKTLMETNKVLSEIRSLDIKEDSQEEE